jgi:quinol monooxygenase YgiN
LRLVTENARISAETEPGCRQFEVVVPNGGESRVYLYEVYDDQSAFDRHKAQAHFIEFDRLSSDLVEAKTVTIGKLHFAGRKRRSRAKAV